MAFPQWLARVNRRVTNRVMARFVGIVPHLSMLHHRGRKTGTPYRVPVMVFPWDNAVAIALTYGPDVDWLKNIIVADGCTVTAGNREWVLGSPRIVHGDDLPGTLPQPFRMFLRLLRVNSYVMLSIRS